jgi:large subunit ribosomal protein L35Ae
MVEKKDDKKTKKVAPAKTAAPKSAAPKPKAAAAKAAAPKAAAAKPAPAQNAEKKEKVKRERPPKPKGYPDRSKVRKQKLKPGRFVIAHPAVAMCRPRYFVNRSTRCNHRYFCDVGQQNINLIWFAISRLYAKAIFVGFKRGLRNQHENTALLKVEGCHTLQEARWYVGKKAAFVYRVSSQ